MGCEISCSEYYGIIHKCAKCNRDLHYKSNNNLCQLCNRSTDVTKNRLIEGVCHFCGIGLGSGSGTLRKFCNSYCRDEFLKHCRCKLCLTSINHIDDSCPGCFTKFDTSNIFGKNELASLIGVKLCQYCSKVIPFDRCGESFCSRVCETAKRKQNNNSHQCGMCDQPIGYSIDGPCFKCRRFGPPKPKPSVNFSSPRPSEETKVIKKKKVIHHHHYHRK